MSVYDPLKYHLGRKDGTEWTASFEEVERILNRPLPRSAFVHSAWWSNDRTAHVQARAWLDAGWHTGNLNLTARRITFIRQRP